jgi:hypothetical protein
MIQIIKNEKKDTNQLCYYFYLKLDSFIYDIRKNCKAEIYGCES